MSDPIIAGNRARAGAFLKKSQRAATKSDDANRSVRLEDDGYLAREFSRFRETFNTRQIIDGSSVPKPVAVKNGAVSIGSLYDFYGFTKDNIAVSDIARFLNETDHRFSSSSASFSFTANAGTDRYLIVWLWHDSSQAAPTGGSWNGNTLALLADLDDGFGSHIQMWAVAIGDSVTNETANVTFTGGATSNTFRYAGAVVYENVDQTTPITLANIEATTSGGSSVATPDVQLTDSYGLIVGFVAGYDSGSITTPSFTVRDASDGINYGDIETSNAVSIAGTRSGNNITAIGAALNSAGSGNDIDVLSDGIVDGFSSLTVGVPYFIDDTSGGIATDGAGARVGVAVSATEILVERPKRRAVGSATLNGSTTIAVDCGFTPRVVRLSGTVRGDGSDEIGFSNGVWVDGQAHSVYGSADTSGHRATNFNSTYPMIMYRDNNSDLWFSAEINRTATGFEIVLVDSTNGTGGIVWEAEE